MRRIQSKGRGAGFNPQNRFESISYETREEWLDAEDTSRPQTEFLPDNTKSILATNQSPDLGFEVSINAYRGCEHGCIYCYARPFHEYLGYSAGVDFETRILVKHDAAALLRKDFLSRKWEPKTVEMSGVTDPYQPAERRFQLTRELLNVFLEFRNPVAIVTKNALICRDIDILSQLAEFHLVSVLISVTTLDPAIARVLEPRTSHPRQRIDAIRALSEAGIQVGAFVAPVIPGLTDTEMPAILREVKNAGAQFAGFIPVKLSGNVAPLFEDWLERHFPARKERVLNRIRDIRRGKLHDSRFYTRMRGEGAYADHLHSLFHATCRTLNLPADARPLETKHFQRPEGPQLSLF